MAIAISPPKLFHKITEPAKAAGLQPEEISSLSWFKFQFWPKNSTVHSVINYTGHLKICYALQQ